MSAHAPSYNTAFICLIVFIVAVVGYFVPMGHVAHIGQYLKYINFYAVYLLIGGYGLLLAAVYIL